MLRLPGPAAADGDAEKAYRPVAIGTIRQPTSALKQHKCVKPYPRCANQNLAFSRVVYPIETTVEDPLTKMDVVSAAHRASF